MNIQLEINVQVQNEYSTIKKLSGTKWIFNNINNLAFHKVLTLIWQDTLWMELKPLVACLLTLTLLKKN